MHVLEITRIIWHDVLTFICAGFMFTFMLFIAALRKNVGFILLLGFLWLTFLLLAVGELTLNVRSSTVIFKTTTDTYLPRAPQASATKAGGAFGIVTAFIAYYCAVSELLVREDSYFMLPLGHIPKRAD
jgi:succinate-acetate transporter protein